MSTFNKYRLKGAYHYDWYETEDWYKWLVDRCVRFCNGPTLEIGCGDGLLSKLISDKGHNVIALDPDPDGIKLAREKAPKVDFRQMKAEPLTDGNGHMQFDYLASINVIEHMDDPEVLLEILDKNIVKGAIITTIDWQGGTFGEDHRKEYTLPELANLFRGYKVKTLRYQNTEWIGVEVTK